VGQFQKALKPRFLGVAVVSDVVPGLGIADDGTKSNREDIFQLV